MYLKIVLYKNMDVSKLLFVVHEITTYFLCLGNIICLKTISVFFVFWLFLVVLSTCVIFLCLFKSMNFVCFSGTVFFMKNCNCNNGRRQSCKHLYWNHTGEIQASPRAQSLIIITHCWVTDQIKSLTKNFQIQHWNFISLFILVKHISATEVQLGFHYECCLVNFYRGINQERWNWCNHEKEEDPVGSKSLDWSELMSVTLKSSMLQERRRETISIFIEALIKLISVVLHLVHLER